MGTESGRVRIGIVGAGEIVKSRHIPGFREIPGVEIVSSSMALASKNQPKDEQIRPVLSFAKPHYEWTVVDLGRSLRRFALGVTEERAEA